MSWSAKQYVAFEDERTRPVRDLLSTLPDIGVRRAIDLGCGPGNSTEVLQARFPGARVSGVDSSDDMIAAARKRLPQLEFTVADVADWQDSGPYDVILANAVLQWVPDHAALLPALVSKLAAGGALAVQMPDNLDVPAHRLMRKTAASGPWSHKMAQAAEAPYAVEVFAEWYYELLQPLATRTDIWRTTYYHSLAGGAAAIVDWFKGSGLRPYLSPLDDAERSALSTVLYRSHRAVLSRVSGRQRSPPFPRLFLVAIR